MAKERHPSQLPPQQDRAACGVTAIINLPNPDKQLPAATNAVEQGCTRMEGMAYRGATNVMTGLSDGAGQDVGDPNGLPPEFFQQKLDLARPNNGIQLDRNKFAVGNFFMPAAEKQEQARQFIGAELEKNGFTIAGWRAVDDGIDPSVLPEAAQKLRQPQQMAIIVHKDGAEVDERTLLRISSDLRIALQQPVNSALEDIGVISLSRWRVIYKDIVHPKDHANLFTDLKTLQCSYAGGHIRFATKALPKSRAAQPMELTKHNGEINSSPQEGDEMVALREKGDIAPDNKSSDTARLDTDIHNMICRGYSLEETMTLLLPPPVSLENSNYPPHIKDMVQYNALFRSPCNGPAFLHVCFDGDHLFKKDTNDLRPMAWMLLEDKDGNRQFRAASDSDNGSIAQGMSVVDSGTLCAGEVLMVTQNGKILHNMEVLERVHGQSLARLREVTGQMELTFAERLRQRQALLEKPGTAPDIALPSNVLQQKMALFHHHEATVMLKAMMQEGKVPTGAMGNDTLVLEPNQIAGSFSQNFSQISEPPIDTLRETCDLSMVLGKKGDERNDDKGWQMVALETPVLHHGQLAALEEKKELVHVLNATFPVSNNPEKACKDAIKSLIAEAKKIAENAKESGAVLVISDRGIDKDKVAIPDLIALGAVKQYLRQEGLARYVSLVLDSGQIADAHQVSTAITLGAEAVNARGIWEETERLVTTSPAFDKEKRQHYFDNVQHALEESLKKAMGRKGMGTSRAFCGGAYVSAFGIDLTENDRTSLDTEPGLGSIFPGIYSPVKGFTLGDFARRASEQHKEALAVEYMTQLPDYGWLKPNPGGIKHAFGPKMMEAHLDYQKDDQARWALFTIYKSLEKTLRPEELKDFLNVTDKEVNGKPNPHYQYFEPETGFLNPEKRDLKTGLYPKEYLNRFRPSKAYQNSEKKIAEYHRDYPTSVADLFHLDIPATNKASIPLDKVQPLCEIIETLSVGAMSRGALTTEAKRTLTRGANSVRVVTNTGEGSESPAAPDIEQSLVRQLGSAQFGVTAAYLNGGQKEGQPRIIEIKINQGAKPGSGGEIPGQKVLGPTAPDIKTPHSDTEKHMATASDVATLRQCIPGILLASPAPRHDIYSIEDLLQFVYDLHSFDPKAQIDVKIVAEPSVDSSVLGIFKSGGHINLADYSGGTGAADRMSQMHAGLDAFVALWEATHALTEAGFINVDGMKDLTTIKTSGSFQTASQIAKAIANGAHSVEFGTMAMVALENGCRMLRTCNQSCDPGVATNGENYRGDERQVALYFLNVAAELRNIMAQLGIKNLDELRGRRDLFSTLESEIAPKQLQEEIGSLQQQIKVLHDSKQVAGLQEHQQRLAQLQQIKQSHEQRHAILTQKFDFSRKDAAPTKQVKTTEVEQRLAAAEKDRQDRRVDDAIIAQLSQNPAFGNKDKPLDITCEDRSIGARIASHMVTHKDHKAALYLKGSAGQSFGAFTTDNTELHLEGTAENFVGKAMSGGKVVVTPSKDVTAPHKNLAGYGTGLFQQGGKIYMGEGRVGSRTGVRQSGGVLIVQSMERANTNENKALYPGEFSIGGTFIVLTGEVGQNFCTHSYGGVKFVYDDTGSFEGNMVSHLRLEDKTKEAYLEPFKRELAEYYKDTGSVRAKHILDNFNPAHLKVALPTALDTIKTVDAIREVTQSFLQRHLEVSFGERIWLAETTKAILAKTKDDLTKYHFTDERFALLDETLGVLAQAAHQNDQGKTQASLKTLEQRFKENAAIQEHLKEFQQLNDTGELCNRASTLRGELATLRDNLSHLAELEYVTRLKPVSGKAVLDEQTKGVIASTVQEIGVLKGKAPKELPQSQLQAAAIRSKGVARVVKLNSTATRTTPAARDNELLPLFTDLNINLQENFKEYIAAATDGGAACTDCNAQSCAGVEVSTGCDDEKPIKTINALLQEVVQMQLGANSSNGVLDLEAQRTDILSLKNKDLLIRQLVRLRQAAELYGPFPEDTGKVCPAPCKDACTVTLKPGEKEGAPAKPVPIKENEHILSQMHKLLWRDEGTFDSSTEKGREAQNNHEQRVQNLLGLNKVFFAQYKKAMQPFTPLFQKHPVLSEGKVQHHNNAENVIPFPVIDTNNTDKSLHEKPATIHALPTQPPETGHRVVIVGSGPAGRRAAYQLLRQGIAVSMYDASDKVGGLLVDGIPPHKGLARDLGSKGEKHSYDYLIGMGLDLHLNAKVAFHADSKTFTLDGTDHIIARGDDERYTVMLCVGAGQPRDLDTKVTAGLSDAGKGKIRQALDFLKAFNDLDDALKQAGLDWEKGSEDQAKIKALAIGHLDQFFGGKLASGEKIDVAFAGGGDTAQDLERELSKVKTMFPNIQVYGSGRGPASEDHNRIDMSYPKQGSRPTDENRLRDEERKYTGATFNNLCAPVAVTEENGRLAITESHRHYRHWGKMEETAQTLAKQLPREMQEQLMQETGREAIICDTYFLALGTKGHEHNPDSLVYQTLQSGAGNVFVAGDAVTGSKQTVIGAEHNASVTVTNKVLKAIPKDAFNALAQAEKHAARQKLESSQQMVKLY